MSVLLDKWDAAELFNKIIARYDKKDAIEKLRSTVKFEQRLKDYSVKKVNALVTEKIFGSEQKLNKKTNKLELSVRNPTAFYEFCRQLNHGEPVIIADDIFKVFKKHIRDENFAEDSKIVLRDFKLNQKQRDLEDTKWWVYFYDECTFLDKNKKPKLYKGVSRAILFLKPFGKAELIRLKKDVDEKRIYTGIYRVCKHDEYLSFKMKIKDTRERDLRMLFYIGTDKMNLALGLSANTSDSFYARTVMIEPLKIVDNENPPKPRFYSKALNDRDNKDLPDHVWQYFEDEGKNIIRLPQGKLTSPEKLSAWLKPKSNDQNKDDKAP